MNSNHAYMHGYYSCANDFFYSFFLSPSGCSLICLFFTTKQEKDEWSHVNSGLFDIIKN